MIRARVEVSYGYTFERERYDQEKDLIVTENITTAAYFYGSEGEVNWWLLSMEIKYPGGVTGIIKTHAVVL